MMSYTKVGVFIPLLFFATSFFAQHSFKLLSNVDSQTVNYATIFSSTGIIGYVFNDSIVTNSIIRENIDVKLWAMGFDTISIRLPIEKDTIVYLARKKIILDTVSVEHHRCTDVIRLGAVKGNLQKRHGKLSSVFGPGLPIHYQSALRISHSDFYFSNCQIQSINIYMPVTPDRQQGTIRLRVYEERADTALPGRDLLHSEILKQVVNDGRWYEIDISEEYILVSGNFYVGFETMPSYTGQLPDYGIIVQKGPHQTWMYHAKENVWFQFIGMEDWKRIPNQAAKVLLVCPCRD